MKVHIKTTITDDNGRIISVHDHEYSVNSSDGSFTLKEMLDMKSVFSDPEGLLIEKEEKEEDKDEC